MDRSWMYDRNFPGRRGLKRSFVDGVDMFVNVVKWSETVLREGGIRCPCQICMCRKFGSEEEIKLHLYNNGFLPNYFIWTSHGEATPSSSVAENIAGSTSSRAGPSHVQYQPLHNSSDIHYQSFSPMNLMIDHALGFNEAVDDETETLPNLEAQRFYHILKETNKPLFEGSPHSKLSMCVDLLDLKSQDRVAEKGLDKVTKMLLNASPVKDNLPRNFYEAKQLVSKLGLGVKRIDCCVKGCMLFYDNEFGLNDSSLVECKFCQEPRYRVKHRSRSNQGKPVPRKAMFYLPIVTRLQRMFASMKTAGNMTWHFENKTNTGELRHPSDGLAWKHFDQKHPDFALEPRNVRLGLCSDGFTPYIQASGAPYSCWPILVTPYNLPPDMCMSKPYMFLAAVIPGPTSPKSGVDIFLQPLVDDLKRLWNGVVTYDISRKENFIMRAMLMWTINDFPAYGMLSGWGTHGKLACPICMEDTEAFGLHNGGKATWFDEHRRWLPEDHPFRRNKNAFVKGHTETRGPPVKLSSEQVWNKVKDLPKIQVVAGEVSRPRDYGNQHNWTKRSIFWDLPYWKDNLLRHNLDVMHIEKNVFDNIFNTVMNVKGKTKDNEKARQDLALYCRRKDLLLVESGNGKKLKPRANFTLTNEQSKSVYQWIKELKMPDGYSSNLARCVDMVNQKMYVMKSHDCHVFMECLLPIAFSSLPKHVWTPLVEVSQFFKNLCSSTLRDDELIKMEENMPLILCKLERIFPPGFFDSMEHLMVHLAYEARLGGPVQYRWMYPFERFMGDSKRSVRNKAKVEGSICSAYVSRETSHFISHYFITTSSSTNETISEIRGPLHLSVFGLEGRPGGGGMPIIWPSEQVLSAAHVHVLINCAQVTPYVEAFLASEQISPEQSSTQLHSEFPTWFRERVYLEPPTPINLHLRNLADGPDSCVKQWHTYFVNGYKFHTRVWTEGKETINSGVWMKGFTDQSGNERDFYGVIEHIYEIAYPYLDYKKSVVLFYCNWFDPRSSGTKLNKLTNTVDIRMNGRYQLFDPFVLAHNARQVYYVPYPSTKTDKKGWCAAIKTKPRDCIETDNTEDTEAYQNEEISRVNTVEVEPFSRLCDDFPNTGEEVDENEIEIEEEVVVDSTEISSSDDDFGNE